MVDTAREVRSRSSTFGIVSTLRRLYSRWIPAGITCFPSIDGDLEELRPLLRGRVLNAGVGIRQLSHLIDGELVNQDITWLGDDRTDIQINSPLLVIPVDDDHFDAILCVAVLEHAENPAKVLAEMFRVRRPGGHLILEVPFLQPEHKVPTDFQRYTRDGLYSCRCCFTAHAIRPRTMNDRPRVSKSVRRNSLSFARRLR